jgi:hypothetical protein
MAETLVQARRGLQSGPHLIVGGCATLAAFVLAFLAFDDITTDNATTFTLEYGLLLLCAAWCLFVSIRLIGRGNRVLGILSLVTLTGAVWGQRRIGPGTAPAWQPEYLATATGMLWLLALSAILVVMGFRHLRR